MLCKGHVNVILGPLLEHAGQRVDDLKVGAALLIAGIQALLVAHVEAWSLELAAVVDCDVRQDLAAVLARDSVGALVHQSVFKRLTSPRMRLVFQIFVDFLLNDCLHYVGHEDRAALPKLHLALSIAHIVILVQIVQLLLLIKGHVRLPSLVVRLRLHYRAFLD